MTNAMQLLTPKVTVRAAWPADKADLLAVQTQIFQATRAAPRPLHHLMSWVIDRRNLTAAWEKVAAADGADTPGEDGQTCAQLRSRVGPWLAELAEALFHRRYVPGRVRRIDIPKPNKPGQTRQIGILTVRDRVIHTALRQVLEPVLEPVFLPTSFGFRPGRCVAAALDAAVSALSAPPGRAPDYAYAVPLDVADCFPTIDHATLLHDLAAHVADPDLLDLVARCVAAGGERTGHLWWQRHRGLVQGGPLSPLLCNLALHPLDLAADQIARSTQRGVLVLRYADDLLLLARDTGLAASAVATLRGVLKDRFQKFKAEPKPVPVAQGIEWLGVRLQPRRLARPGETAFGYVVPEEKVRDMIDRLVEMTVPPSDKIDAAAFNLSRWIVCVNAQLRDWRQVYLFADNAPDVFRVLDDVAFERVGELIKAVNGTSWTELRRNHLVRLPRGFRTWEVPGARLCVLSALAPCAPANLVRRPAWWKEAPAVPSAPTPTDDQTSPTPLTPPTPPESPTPPANP